jgi:hypothetical protein
MAGSARTFRATMIGFQPYETFQLLIETGGIDRTNTLLCAACDAFARRGRPRLPKLEQFTALAQRLFPAAAPSARAKAAATLGRSEFLPRNSRTWSSPISAKISPTIWSRAEALRCDDAEDHLDRRRLHRGGIGAARRPHQRRPRQALPDQQPQGVSRTRDQHGDRAARPLSQRACPLGADGPPGGLVARGARGLRLRPAGARLLRSQRPTASRSSWPLRAARRRPRRSSARSSSSRSRRPS